MTCLNRDPPELRRDVMLSQTNAHRLAITNLGHVGAHIGCLRIINICSVKRDVTQPSTDGVDVDARAEKMRCCRVPDGMRAHPFVR